MKTPKVKPNTREEILIENTQLKANIENLLSIDGIQRQEFAKAFMWREEDRGSYGYTNSTAFKMPSWAVIFVEIGKLLQIASTMSDRKKISELTDTIFELNGKLNAYEKKNNPTA